MFKNTEAPTTANKPPDIKLSQNVACQENDITLLSGTQEPEELNCIACVILTVMTSRCTNMHCYLLLYGTLYLKG